MPAVQRRSGIIDTDVHLNDPNAGALAEFLPRQYRELGFGDRLEHIFAAGRMGLAKPDARFYEAVTETLGVNPDEVLIVDDFEENVEAAIDAGWQGIHFTPEIREVIGDLLPRPQM